MNMCLKSMKSLIKYSLVSLPFAAALPHMAAAQSATGSAAPPSLLEEITVTAQKRSESLQKTPISITALSGDTLTARGQTTLDSVAQMVPGLNMSQQIGQARITLRGIGVDNISTGSEASIAFNQDGVFFSRSSAALASFYDIERVEVLRGPQGTLYGRNATGGSVNIITNKPTDELGGYLSVTGGNYDTINTEGALNVPLSDKVAARVAFQTQNHDGYGTNIVTGNDVDSKDSEAVRGQLQFDASDAFTILITGDYYHSSDSSNGYHYFGPGAFTATGEQITPTGLLLGGYAPESELDIASARDTLARAEHYGGRIRMDYAINDTVSVASLTAYRRTDFELYTDISPLAVDLFPIVPLREESKQFSQEFQLNVETDRHSLVAGVYYLHEKIDGEIIGPFNLLAVGGPDFLVQGFYSGGKMKTEAAAVYAQDVFSITDRLRLTVGARYSWEKKSVDDQGDFDLARPFDPANIPLTPHHIDDKSFDAFTPKIGLDYDLSDDTLIYASFSKGFKSGTYNLGSALPALDPEKIKAFEVGLKTTLLDNRFRANLTGFYYDYTDLQVNKVSNFVLVLENAATAEIYGMEGEFSLQPFEAPLLVTLNTSFLHARFDEYVTADPSRPAGDGVTIDPDSGLPGFDLHGKKLAQAPDYSINLGIEYTFDTEIGEINLRGESYWVGKVYFSPFNFEPLSQPAYNLQNAYISYEAEDGSWNLTAFIRNIRDKEIRASGQIATTYVGAPMVGFVQPPRTFGATLSYRF